MPIWSNNLSRMPLVLLALAELGVLFVSVYLAYLLATRGVDYSSQPFDHVVPRAFAVTVVMFLSLIAMGLYQFHQRIYFREVLARVIVGVLLGLVVLAATYPLFPEIRIQPAVAAGSAVCGLALLFAIRYGFVRYIDSSIFRRRTLVLGAGERSIPISELRRRADRRGFKIVAMVPAQGDSTLCHCECLVRTDQTLPEIARERGVDEIVIAMDDRRGALPIRELLDCKLKGIGVIDLVGFLERETGKIRLDLVTPSWLILSPGFRTSRVRNYVKRALDLLVVGITLVPALPLMLLIAIAIKCGDGLHATIIYRQRRVGYLGAEFDMLKFRSMVEDAEADGQARWADVDDGRITPIGGFLRKCRLDELPQLFNVLNGEMSIVGPRPERPEFVKELTEVVPHYSERHTMKPGMTGWAQLKYAYGSSSDDALEKLQYDLYYVKNQDLLLDLMIILQTVEVVLWGKGAR